MNGEVNFAQWSLLVLASKSAMAKLSMGQWFWAACRWGNVMKTNSQGCSSEGTMLTRSSSSRFFEVFFWKNVSRMILGESEIFCVSELVVFVMLVLLVIQQLPKFSPFLLQCCDSFFLEEKNAKGFVFMHQKFSSFFSTSYALCACYWNSENLLHCWTVQGKARRVWLLCTFSSKIQVSKHGSFFWGFRLLKCV